MSVNSVEEAIHFAAENGIILSSPPRVAGQYIFLDVNTEATNLAAFYSWAEVNPNAYPMQDAWRPFIWYDSKIGTADSWGTNTLLGSIECFPESIGQILTTYFKTSCVK